MCDVGGDMEVRSDVLIHGFAVKKKQQEWAAGWPRLHDFTHILSILKYYYAHGNVLMWLLGSCIDFHFSFT